MLMSRTEGREIEEVNQSMSKSMCRRLERQRHFGKMGKHAREPAMGSG